MTKLKYNWNLPGVNELSPVGIVKTDDVTLIN